MMELPEELICEIMEHLPHKELGRLVQVCRDLHRIGIEDKIWKQKGFLERSPNVEFAGSSLLPSPRLCHTSLVHNNKMHMFGGHLTEERSQRFMEVKSDYYTYDFAKNVWEKFMIKNFLAKTEHSAVVHNDKFYMFGGYSGKAFCCSLYSITTGAKPHCSLVKTYGDIPTIRSAHIGAVYKDKMYIFGGWNGSHQNNDFYSFEFTTSYWKKLSIVNGPVPRCSHAVSVSHSRKEMYIFGGYGGREHNYLNDLWSFNFESQKWTLIQTKGQIPSPRSRIRMIEWNDKLFIFGGWDKSTHFNEMYQYDISSNTWSKVDLGISKNDSNLKIGQHSMCVNNNILYIFGGFNETQDKSTNQLFAYRLGNRVDRSRLSRKEDPLGHRCGDFGTSLLRRNKFDFSNVSK